MKKKVLIVHAHPEPASLTRHLVEVAAQALRQQGHEVLLSDLYGMQWKAVFDAHDFPSRADPGRLSFLVESGHSYATGRQAADIVLEQQKLLAADAVILQFPLWWFGMPAILKGWIDRVYAYGPAYGFKGAGNRYRYGEGGLKGRRALLSVTVGGPAVDYSPRGVNGPLEHLLFPITHGTLFFPGMDVLATHAVYGAARITPKTRRQPRRAGACALHTSSTNRPFHSVRRTAATIRMATCWQITWPSGKAGSRRMWQSSRPAPQHAKRRSLRTRAPKRPALCLALEPVRMRYGRAAEHLLERRPHAPTA